MGILKKLGEVFGGGGVRRDPDAYWISVRCRRCGEVVQSRVNLANDLSPNYEGEDGGYFCRKILIGDQGCFQRMEVELTFDSARRLIDRQVTGGEFVEEAERS